MTKTLAQPPVQLPHLGVLRIAGADAAAFLQGQLTSDTRLLADGRTQLSALNTPQGRVVALLRLRQVDDAILAVLPKDMLATVAALLGRYVLRARVRVGVADDLVVTWSDGPPPPSAGVLFEIASGRTLIVSPPGEPGGSAGPGPREAEVENAWRAADIAAGLPQIHPSTSGHFVAQMLNLDLLDAISFSKGCYTGQEIVARTQHLGRIKRRMLRYRLPAGPAPAPLAALALEGQKVAEVLMSAAVESGIDLLAVTSLEAAGRTLQADDGREAVAVPMPYGVETAG